MLADLEISQRNEIEKAITAGQRSGFLLSIVPEYDKWFSFCKIIEKEWASLQKDKNIKEYPAILLTLFLGVGFYEYEGHTFWEKFANIVGLEKTSANQQKFCNSLFSDVLQKFGLRNIIRTRSNGIDYVGTIIYCIGVPLSLWDSFLHVCEWALWQGAWRKINNEEWKEIIEKQICGQTRLKKFFIDDREIASNLIQEILDIREIVLNDLSITTDYLAQASILRAEYFEDVPETAEFLRPLNPQSLLQDRAKIVWDQQQNIKLYVPSVKQNMLPATWNISTISQDAASSPDEIKLNNIAFSSNYLHLTLQSGEQKETQRIRGLKPWGLFDVETGGYLVNSNREELPLKSYALISKEEIDILNTDGFDQENNKANEQLELSDGTICFITYLWPIKNRAEFSFKGQDFGIKKFLFKVRAKIEVYLFIGSGYKAAFFAKDKKIIDDLPIICVSIPAGYFKNVEDEVKKRFKVCIGVREASGKWKKSIEEKDREFYKWDWDRIPIFEKIPGAHKLSGLSQLSKVYKPADLTGEQIFTIRAEPDIKKEFSFKVIRSSPKCITHCWKKLPGYFLGMFLLSQPPTNTAFTGIKWEDLVVAHAIIAPEQRFSPYLLYKYKKCGYVKQQGVRWVIAESRVNFKILNDDRLQMDYCGDPSILWGLYNWIYKKIKHKKISKTLPLIEVINRKDEIPYLQMYWDRFFYMELEKYLRKSNVKIGSILWNH